jgi:L-lactate permease
MRAVFGLSPILMGAANSTGGVMGKMIDTQSIVVASTALVRQDGKRRSSKPCSSAASRSRAWSA